MRIEVFQDGRSHTDRPDDLDMLHATFAAPDLTVFCHLDELELVAVDNGSIRIGR